MKRREFLRSVAAVSFAQAVSPLLRADEPPAWAAGFEGLNSDLPPQRMHTSGRFPAACQGTVYRNGPALYARGDQRYEHWFDPDGMIQSFRIAEDGVRHQGCFVRTERFLAEQKAGRFLFGGAGTHFEGALPVRNNETTNVANINVQPLNGELLALWEAGAPYRLDPDSLETRGQLELDPTLKGVPFSAHPHFDEAGDLWNVGSVPFAGRPLLVLYHVGANGRLVKSAAHLLDHAGYMHDFVLTPRHLIALNSSAVFGRGETFVDRMRWEPEQASQLLIFDRQDFSLVRTIEVPATFVFHFGNAWEDGDEIHFTACAYADSKIVSVGMRRLAKQQTGPYHEAAQLTHYRISMGSGSVGIQALGVNMEFPGFDQRQPFAAQPLYGVRDEGEVHARPASAIVRIDPRSGDSTSFDYGEGVAVEEPLYVPGADGGYVLHTYLDYDNGRCGIAALRAEELGDGPIATAEMDRVLPLGFHGCFVAA